MAADMHSAEALNEIISLLVKLPKIDRKRVLAAVAAFIEDAPEEPVTRPRPSNMTGHASR